jgi:hypothetical protein
VDIDIPAMDGSFDGGYDDPVDPRQPVVIPAITGLPVWRAWILVRQAGLDLAGPNQDGRPVHRLVLAPTVRVTSQWPLAGTLVPRWSSVVVTWRDDDPAGVREPRTPVTRSLDGAGRADIPPDPEVLRIDRSELPEPE